MRHIAIVHLLIRYTEQIHSITSVVFLPKLHILHLIRRKHRTKLNSETFCKIIGQSASSAGHLVGRPGGRAHVEELSQSGRSGMEGRELRRKLNSDLCLQGFLLHLLVEVDALCAEDSAIGGRWGLETGIEARERPGGKIFEATFRPPYGPQRQ